MANDDLKEALERCQKAIAELDDPKEVARMLWALTRLRTWLSEVIDEGHSRMYGMMESREQDFGEGVGLLKRTKEAKTTWDHDGMYEQLVDEHKVADPLTGELTIDGFALAKSIRECVAFSYWRKNVLREKKIDFSEHVTDVYGKPRIRFLSKEGH